jgi:hypothetical protein
MKQLKTKFKWKINVKLGTLHSYHSCVCGISTGYGLDKRVWIHGRKMFLFSTTSRQVLGPTQPSIHWVPRALSLWVKWSGREAEIHTGLQKDEVAKSRHAYMRHLKTKFKWKINVKWSKRHSYHPCPWRLDGLLAGWPGLDFWQGQDVSLLHNVQTSSGAHPASYPMSTGGFSPGGLSSGREAEIQLP